MLSRKRREGRRLRDFFRTRNTAMRDLLETVEKVVDHDVSILILGESGTGKNYLAEAIHYAGNRSEQPFVHIDCASIPPDLFESELFGYEKGTFTDAVMRKIGRLETAGTGTVYFDEISALTPPLQAKLLRAMQEKQFTRLGGHEAITLDARIISSSAGDLNALIASGAFRRDLFYRINVVTLALPPLRNRSEDIEALATEFADQKPIAPEALDHLRSLPWRGNVRELENAIKRAVLLAGETAEITSATLPAADPDDLIEAGSRESWTLEQLEERYIRKVLQETRQNYSRAAEILGINRKTLLEKRRKYRIE